MSRILRIGTWTVVLFFAFLFTGETIAGGKRGIRRGGHRQTVADHVVAFAALEALSEGTGWGRFVVRDDLLPTGDERSLEVSLFGLEPHADYLIKADGVEVSRVVTDRKGDASLKLKTRGRYSDEVPNELPAANEILRASVFGAWGGIVLDGTFTVVREHITDPTVHREKIDLEEEDGSDADGMAAVCRKESGAQGFATLASGLEPGLSYSIVVDTVVVGIVTADEEGQAGLELHVPDDENPLPGALQPVDNIRNVKWFQGDLLILSGVFTGESDIDDRCHESEGRFVELTDDGFVLRRGDVDVEIVVTEDTDFEGFEDLAELEEGDWLEVEVCWDGEHLVAQSVELEEHERECDDLQGEVISRTDNGFLLRVGDDHIEVVVTEDTEFKGFDSLDELDGGEIVALEGCFDGDVFVAAWVKLIEDDDCVELRGVVAERTDHGFVLQVDDDLLEVVVTDETRFKSFDSLDELDGGEAVALEGCFDGDVIVAVWVMLLEDDDCVELHGIVVERTDHGFVLRVGDDLVEVTVTEETVFRDFDSLDELDGGEAMALEGCFDGEVLVAAWIRLVEEDDCYELHGVFAERTDLGFVLQVGDDFVEIAVTDATVFKGFDSLDGLEVGDEVALEGCFDGGVLVAVWVRVFEDEPELEWWAADGMVVDLLEHGFAFEADGEVMFVILSEETKFDGYESADQIAENDVVLVEGWYDGEKVYAERVTRGGD